MRLRTCTSTIAACVVWLGCSASNTARHGNVSGEGAQAGNAAAHTDGGVLGSFGNGSAGAPSNALPTGQDAGPDGGGSTSGIMPLSIDACGAQNAAGLSAADAKTLMAGSGSAGSLKLLYPYDGTVFPRGLIAPTLMWDGGGDAVYVHIKSKAFEYKGCLKPTAAGQLQLPQDVWDKAAERTYGSSDPYLFELSTLTGGTATGPVTFHVDIAQATIKGSIYYNTYSSLLPGAIPLSGNVLRIPAGKPVELFISSECNGCHSVSADGSRLLTQRGTASLGGASTAVLAPGGAPNPPLVAAGTRGAFGALYPDGSKYVVNSSAINVARSNLVAGPGDAILLDSNNGNTIPSTGIPPKLVMPMFAPSGAKLAFVNADSSGAKTVSLGVLDFDDKSNAASNVHDVYKETDAAKMPAWPFFLPDEKGIVFLRTDASDFSGGAAGIASGGAGSIFSQFGAAGTPWGELTLLDLASGKASVLAQAMGYKTAADAASGSTYLPFGAEDLHHNYYPTVSPVAAGGYFWVFFDSYRHYGNTGLQRQLWGVAVDIAANGDYTVDRSHPAFYVPGQEFGTGNHRAFAALDPCKKDGDSCTSGIDCCGGYCYVPEASSNEFKMELAGKCQKPVVKTCSKTDEHCVSAADCCVPTDKTQPRNSCISGYCAYVVPQ